MGTSLRRTGTMAGRDPQIEIDVTGRHFEAIKDHWCSYVCLCLWTCFPSFITSAFLKYFEIEILMYASAGQQYMSWSDWKCEAEQHMKRERESY